MTKAAILAFVRRSACIVGVLLCMLGLQSAQASPKTDSSKEKPSPFLYAEPHLTEFHQTLSRPEDSDFVFHPLTETSLILSGLLVGRAPSIQGIHIGGDLSHLDTSNLLAIDRNVVDNWSPTAQVMSDSLLAIGISAPFVASLVSSLHTHSDLHHFGQDSIILLETLAVNCILFNISKFTVKRPRPFAYNDRHSDEMRSGDNAQMSFFSGHTSMAFSMASAYAYLYSKRHPDSPWKVPIWIGSHSLAAMTAFLRVKAGKHFWTDVATGAAIGSLIGLAVPWLHEKVHESNALPDNMIINPTFYEGGFGISTAWTF